MIDRTGHVCGLLTVTRRVNVDGVNMWNCSCACGGTKIVRGSDLASGHVSSCGCLRKTVSTKNAAHMNAVIAQVGPRYDFEALAQAWPLRESRT